MRTLLLLSAVSLVALAGCGGGGGPIMIQQNPPNLAAIPVAWDATATAHRQHVGQRFTFSCPPGGSAHPVWGTGTFTDDSSICTAAVHANVITLANGGNVTIEMRPGQPAYAGSTRNGVTSQNYGQWDGSFVFLVTSA